jgi:hypothetical protein
VLNKDTRVKGCKMGKFRGDEYDDKNIPVDGSSE